VIALASLIHVEDECAGFGGVLGRDAERDAAASALSEL